MQSVNDLIEALMEIYFDEENTAERYKIFAEVEKAMNEARAVTVEQIENLEEFRAQFSFPSIEEKDAKVLAKMSVAVAEAALLDEVILTRETTIQDISEMGDIDSLDMVELTMMFEEILNIDIEQAPPEPETTIGDLLDMRS